MVKLNFFNNTGGINKFSSIASLNESEVNTDWFDAQNVEGYQSGGIAKMKGNKNVCTTSLTVGTKILGIWDYVKGDDHYPIVNTSEGKIYRFDLSDGSLNLIYSGFNQLKKCCYANFNNGVIITNGYNTPVFYEEGSTAVVLTGSPPTGGPIEVYKSRVFIAVGASLHYCALGNANDWTSSEDAGYIENFHNDSSPITALKNYGEFLAIYKNHGTYILSGTSPSDFSIDPVSDKGSPSSWGIGTADNNQYFFNGENITPLRFNELGQITVADDVSIKIKSEFSDLDQSKFNQVVCIPYSKKNQLWFFFSSQKSADLDVCYIYDYFHKSWYKRVGLPVTCGNTINGIIYTGTSDGRILKEDYGDSFDGVAIEAWWYSPWFTFKNPGVPKEINDFSIWLNQDQKYPIEIVYSKDYDSFDQKCSTVEMGETDTLCWDVGFWDNNNWSSSKIVKKHIRVNGSCDSLQIGVRNLSADQYFAILGYSFDVEAADL
jgi:hypothetical protein